MKPEDLVKGKDYWIKRKLFESSTLGQFVKETGHGLFFYRHEAESLLYIQNNDLCNYKISEYREPIKKVVEKEGYVCVNKSTDPIEYTMDYLIELYAGNVCKNLDEAKEAIKGSFVCNTILKFKSRIELEEVVE